MKINNFSTDEFSHQESIYCILKQFNLYRDSFAVDIFFMIVSY